MVSQNWVINCLKMYSIAYKFIKFITKAMEKWKVKLITGGKTSPEVKIQRAIFQGDALSSLLFVIAMMPFNHILTKFTGGYKFTRSQEKNNHLMYMDNIKLFAKNEKELEILIQTIRIYILEWNLALKNVPCL